MATAARTAEQLSRWNDHLTRIGSLYQGADQRRLDQLRDPTPMSHADIAAMLEVGAFSVIKLHHLGESSSPGESVLGLPEPDHLSGKRARPGRESPRRSRGVVLQLARHTGRVSWDPDLGQYVRVGPANTFGPAAKRAKLRSLLDAGTLADGTPMGGYYRDLAEALLTRPDDEPINVSADHLELNRRRVYQDVDRILKAARTVTPN